MFIADGAVKAPLAGVSPALYWAFDCAKFFVLPALVLVAAWRWAGIGPSAYDLVGGDGARTFGRTAVDSILVWLGLTVVYFLGGPLLAAALTAVGVPAWPPVFDLGGLMPTGAGRTLTTLYISVGAGVAEELMFRGLAAAFALRLPRGRGLQLACFHFVSTILFAAGHWESGFDGVAGAAAVGIAAGLIYLRLRRLLPLILGHIGVDLIAFW